MNEIPVQTTISGRRIHDNDATYFLTFTVVNWIDVFTRARYCDIIVNSLNFCIEKKGLVVYSWVIMSNHIHLICKAVNGNLSGVIRDFKKHTSKEIIKSIKEEEESRRDWMLWMFERCAKKEKREGYTFWREGNHAEELISNHFKDQKLFYIHNNPVAARIVVEAHDYLWSSAIDYSDGKGLVKIEKM